MSRIDQDEWHELNRERILESYRNTLRIVGVCRTTLYCGPRPSSHIDHHEKAEMDAAIP